MVAGLLPSFGHYRHSTLIGSKIMNNIKLKAVKWSAILLAIYAVLLYTLTWGFNNHPRITFAVVGSALVYGVYRAIFNALSSAATTVK